jgi:two-component system, OmpR family, alkaline phosphatase synthesis response regulator PhoP
MERTVVAAFGETIIDFDRMEIRRSERTVAATPLEFRLVKFLIENPEHIFSRDELIRAVWRPRSRLSARTVDNSILHLRQKLEHDPAHPLYFRTVHGVGYRFVPFGGLLREFSDQRYDVVRGGMINSVGY